MDTADAGIVRADSAQVFEPVRDVVAYLDTVQVRCRGRVSRPFLDELRAHSGSVSVVRSRFDGSRTVTLNQPQSRALALFAERERYDAVVRRVDLALDYLVSDERTARKLLKQVAYRLNPPHSRRSPTWFPDGDPCPTFYLGERNAGRTWALYGDRPSKLAGGACLHVELRVSGPLAVQRFLRCESRVRPYELRALNPRELLNGLLRFAEVDSKADPRRVALTAHAAPLALFDSVNDGPRLPVTAWRAVQWRTPFRNAYVMQLAAPFELPEELKFCPIQSRARPGAAVITHANDQRPHAEPPFVCPSVARPTQVL